MKNFSVVWGFLAGLGLVYVSAAGFLLITGNAVFAGGLADWRYLALAVLIGAALAVGGIGKRASSVVAIGMFTVLFVLTYGIMSGNPPDGTPDALFTRLMVYPVLALGISLGVRVAMDAEAE
ncbi:hypothetical protein [Edaphobacillus lindanitolerans]|uniref:Uncharacterized protein n=1 Tax=Edaphobacillus lindanitolerans TaxID=550447 RepID=A0A1U7PRV7_9BACI|nr:hypothetical protein [Edaphobacillus lindanitolerans]SIT87989.1 hypothetical protein SAMN05428946_2203 [Edaphobacillus lindanitolerans]